ncbi:MAG: sigma 54-interacting transcriptional regulator [bacterium]
MENYDLEIDTHLENFIIPDGIVVIGADCVLVSSNEAVERITGFKDIELIKQKCDVLFRDDDNNNHNIVIDALTTGQTYSNLSIYINCKNGDKKNVLASITPVHKGKENIIGVIFVFRDTKEMLLLAKELEKKTTQLINERNKLEAIFNSNIEGTFTIDNNWFITSFNKSAEKITGYKREEAIGQKCWNIFKSNICQNGCHMEQTMTKGKATLGNELTIFNKNNKIIPIRVNSGILVDNKNIKIGAVETFIDISEIKNLSEHILEKFKLENIVGTSKKMEKIFSLCKSVSQTRSSVLLTGESGTGKELVARAIHIGSSEKNAPFVALNCSAFAESLIESELFGHEAGAFTGAIKTKMGHFELAQGGTLFLDEIGDISSAVQTKLLRVLETRQFERVGGTKTIKMDVRIIAATNKNLQEEIQSGRFREDLLFRINVMHINLPPLRERIEDLPLLIEHFLSSFNRKFNKFIQGLSSAAYKIFLFYNWPGNIRELENVLEHCFILCTGSTIELDHLPERLLTGSVASNTITVKLPLQNAEIDVINKALKKHDFNKTKAAAELGIDKSTLWRKMKRFNIK